MQTFAAARAKIERSALHLKHFHAELTNYLSDKPFLIVQEEQADKSTIFKVQIDKPVPSYFSSIIGDVIHNLRCALDLLATDLARLNGHQSRSALNETYFPICAGPAQLQAAKLNKIRRLSADAQRRIEEIQPYKDGQGAVLYDLHQLDIADKHVSLIPVGAAYVSRSIGSYIGGPDAPLSDTYPEGIEIDMGVTFQLPETSYPIETGTIIATIFDVSDPRARPLVEADFNLVFHGLGVAEGQLVFSTLKQFLLAVIGVVALFERELAPSTSS